MAVALHPYRHRVKEQRHQYHEGRRGHCQRNQRGGVHLHRVFPAVMVGETEEAGLHTICQHYQRQRYHRVHVGIQAILRRSELDGIQRHQAPVEKTPDDAAQAVYGRIFHQ